MSDTSRLMVASEFFRALAESGLVKAAFLDKAGPSTLINLTPLGTALLDEYRNAEGGRSSADNYIVRPFITIGAQENWSEQAVAGKVIAGRLVRVE